MLWLLRLVALAAIAAAVAWAVGAYNEARREEGRAEVHAEWQAERLASARETLRQTEARHRADDQLAITNERISDEAHQARLARAAADADTGQRLRDFHAQLDAARAAAAAHPGPGAGTDAAPAAADRDDPRPRIAGECAAALRTVEDRAARLADQTRGLQAYARDVCLKAAEPPP